MENETLRDACKEILDAAVATQRDTITLSHAVEAIRLSLADLHPQFDSLYQEHLQDLSHNFEQSREKANSSIRRLGSLIYVQSPDEKP
jgi:hypothetical protein